MWSLSYQQVRTVFYASTFVVGSAILGGCSVQPLYGGYSATDSNLPAKSRVPSRLQEKLRLVAIDAPNDRFSQLVRNRLVFLFGGGAGEAEKPQYSLTLNAGYFMRTAVQVNIGDTTDKAGRASAGTIVASSQFVLKDDKGQIIAKNSRSTSAAFDRPRQEYANLQAEENAQKRAAEELAELVYLSVAQRMVNLPQ